MSNGQSNESINSLNESQSATRVQSGTPLRKVSKFSEQKYDFNLNFLHL